MLSRQKVWIDARIQGLLVTRILIYWVALAAYLGTAVSISQICDHPDWNFSEHTRAWFGKVGPWLPSMFLLLPLVLYDFVRASHAFAGPVRRVGQQLVNLLHDPN